MNPSSDPPGSSRQGKRPMIPSSSSSSSESSSSSSSERSRRAAAAAVAAVAAAAAAAEEEKPQAVNAECYVCGRRFGAWKALFGHMRCHPEREWRGVRPMAEGEGSSRGRRKWRRTTGEAAAAAAAAAQEPADGQYKCGECLRVFETRQALGGHRASHRGVMGCSAKAKETTAAAAAVAEMRGGDGGAFVCQLCGRQFATYHGMRVHQKVHRERRGAAAEGGREVRGFAVDLNLPPPPEAEEEEEEEEEEEAAADKDAGE